MGKWKKKLRKFAKKAAPIAMLALGAAALAKRRKAKALNAITAGGVDTGPLSGKAGYEGDVPSAPQRREGRGGTHMSRSRDQGGLGISQSQAQAVSDANREAGMSGWGLAKGGRVGVGKAKRGFGRALRKK